MKPRYTPSELEDFSEALQAELRAFQGAYRGLDQPTTLARLVTYGRMLVEQNQWMNLTALTTPEQVAHMHFLDSLQIIPYLEGILKTQQPVNAQPSPARWIDVGTGAGFPGLALKIAMDPGALTLLDSLQKRLRFLETVVETLELTNVDTCHGRAETVGHASGYREQYDWAIARAVAPLPTLLELCLPLVKCGGFFFALKGPGEDPRLANPALKKLGGEWVQRWDYQLPQGQARSLWCVQKIASTPKRYPRKPGEPSRRPL